jgi:hypothetical protein
MEKRRSQKKLENNEDDQPSGYQNLFGKSTAESLLPDEPVGCHFSRDTASAAFEKLCQKK